MNGKIRLLAGGLAVALAGAYVYLVANMNVPGARRTIQFGNEPQ